MPSFETCLCVLCAVQKVERRLDRLFGMGVSHGCFSSLLQRCASIFRAMDARALDTTLLASQISAKQTYGFALDFSWP